ncbi:MAG: AraC family transcriptional regulator [Treponemataceae bacterium]|nr:AraC family transcriptional regulator [Treponemataceae bacterium]
MNNMPAEKLFQVYMDLISQRESEEIYRLNEPVGEGIMKHSHIAKGIELVYSELESYSPNYQAEKKDIDGLEIMYIVDGHGEFELVNRQFVSGEKGDVMIFNCKTGVKKAMLGKSGMNCISIILFTEDTVSFLNDFLGITEFSSSDFFNDIRKSDSAVTFPCGELLEKLFLETIRLPAVYSKYTVKLAVVHAIILLIQKFRDKDISDVRIKDDSQDSYFSGSTGRKVQNVRRIINSNLEKEISIEKLAAKVNLNRTSLQRVFKEMYGLTVKEYRTKARIQLAKNLLASTELSITEIAGRCGYANASKFSEVFKKNEGVLPKDWRK